MCIPAAFAGIAQSGEIGARESYNNDINRIRTDANNGDGGRSPITVKEDIKAVACLYAAQHMLCRDEILPALNVYSEPRADALVIAELKHSIEDICSDHFL